MRDTSERISHDIKERETASTVTTAALTATPPAATPPPQPNQGNNRANAATAHRSTCLILDIPYQYCPDTD